MVTIDLSGKTAVVTGAAAGIGKACAQLLSSAGADIAVVDIDSNGAEATARELQRAHAFMCDLGSESGIETAGGKIQESLGCPDIIVNCAGLISYRKGLKAVGTDEWDSLLRVNLRGAFLLSRFFIDGMKEKGWGKIVHFSSLAARVGGIEVGAHYAASKAGLIGLVRTLAKEAAPHGITVNAIAPGIVGTAPVLAQIEDHLEEYGKTIPLGRIGTPEEVARVVLFLCSPLSDYITGVTVDVNGGMYMG